MARIRIYNSETAEQAEERRYYTAGEVAATDWWQPLFRALTPAVGVLILSIVIAFLRKEPADVLYGLIVALAVAGLKLIGVWDAISTILHYLFPPRLDVDADKDGIASPQEISRVERLFTPEGLKEFVVKFMFVKADWTARTLQREGYSYDVYKILTGDILPEIGVLAKRAVKNRSRKLKVGGREEACQKIDAYFLRKRRKFWSLRIEGADIRL